MEKHDDFDVDFELPTVEAKKPAARKMHVSDSTCESCEG
jgi:hypothetical protein